MANELWNELPRFETVAAFYGDMESALRECAEDILVELHKHTIIRTYV